MSIAYTMLIAAKPCMALKTSLPLNLDEAIKMVMKAGEEYAKSEAELERLRNALKILYPFTYEKMLTPEVELKKRPKRKKARNKRRCR